MPFENAESLMRALLTATKSSQVRTILDEIGDHAGAELDQPFGPFNFCWHAFGNNPSNISSIGLGTKPGRSLTERVTNAIDAVLEDRAPSNVTLPNSARLAAQQWFGRPVSGPDDGMFKWDYSEGGNDRRYSVVITESGNEGAPSIDVIDDGIGIGPDDFPGTILSLQQGNKIKKWHLIGAFGQGGASTLSFSEYAIIISRHRDNPRVIGFTIIRVLKLNEQYKEDCYAYLCLRGPSGTISVPSCQVGDAALPLYSEYPAAKVPEFSKGTIVRHVAYQLPKLIGSLGPSPGNLYHYLHCSAFDPLLPFRLVDLRGGEVDNQIVTGSRNRLMGVKDWDPANIKTGSFMRYSREMEYFAPHGTTDPCIGIEFWVVYSYRPGRGKQKDEVVLRPQLERGVRADRSPGHRHPQRPEPGRVDRAGVARFTPRHGLPTHRHPHRRLEGRQPRAARVVRHQPRGLQGRPGPDRPGADAGEDVERGRDAEGDRARTHREACQARGPEY
jgi:hypothetical protein